ncbi:hypothetical protein [Bartonella mastomydis]|nr:hypothetical protein [Bartonella mastomydis]
MAFGGDWCGLWVWGRFVVNAGEACRKAVRVWLSVVVGYGGWGG